QTFYRRLHLSQGFRACLADRLVQGSRDSFSERFEGSGKYVFLVAKVEIKASGRAPRFGDNIRHSRGVIALAAEQVDGGCYPPMPMRIFALRHFWRCAISHVNSLCPLAQEQKAENPPRHGTRVRAVCFAKPANQLRLFKSPDV